jgi:ketosteroid isomerase-like protein
VPDDKIIAMVAELHARREISELLHRYCRAVDRKDFELVRSVYHPDAYDEHGDYQGGVDGLIEYMRERQAAIDQTMHLLGSSSIELDLGEDRAFGETYYTLHMRRARNDDDTPPQRITIGARYLDKFERRNEQWRIARRVCTYEWWNEETCPGERRLEPHWAQAKPSREDLVYTIDRGFDQPISADTA